MAYRFEVGRIYETQNGNFVRVNGRSDEYRGYETLICSDGRHRYDRSTHSDDAGRCTGSNHDYSNPWNIKRSDL